MDHVFGATFARLADAVPEDVELGFHLCYGDLDAEHFVQPIDATKMVDLANLIASRVQRPIEWMHMPVPIGPARRGVLRAVTQSAAASRDGTVPWPGSRAGRGGGHASPHGSRVEIRL